MREELRVVNAIIRECREHHYCAEEGNVCPYWDYNLGGCIFLSNDSEVDSMTPEQW